MGPKYPNLLRDKRESAPLTRVQLADLSAEKLALDPKKYSAISVRGLERLEGGEVQPRMKTAVTMAEILGVPINELFPHGLALRRSRTSVDGHVPPSN